MAEPRLYTPSGSLYRTAESSPDEQLVELVASCYNDPLKFVTVAYPWGEPGPLERYEGPDTWQKEFLIELGEEVTKRKFNGHDPVDPIQMTRSSGHGAGKSVLCGMLSDYIMGTRPNAKGKVTASSYNQLETATWATISSWTKMSIISPWFNITSGGMYRVGKKDSWFLSVVSCAPENSQAFAGQHNAGSTSFYIFDEGSNVDDIIYEVADGGLSDGEPMIFVFGNPIKSHGKFFRINFGSERDNWLHKALDSRDCKFTNKEKIARDEKEWGPDSDRFRVRVRGLPPAQAEQQFIANDTIFEAQEREVSCLPNDPLICGLDIARGGKDNVVFRFRRGLDARSIPAIKIPGEKARDSNVVLSQAINLLKTGIRGRRIDMLFLDGTGVGGPIGDQLVNLGYRSRVKIIGFGNASPNLKGYEAAANMRSWMWVCMKTWLERGAIDKDTALEMDLKSPKFQYNVQDEVKLESKDAIKARLGSEFRSASPDDGDALALTFAYPVQPRHSLKTGVGEEEFLDDLEEDFIARGRMWG